ncbi:ribonuclease Z [Pseudofulvibacter geojedonensis]|uniref:Ribonuclease Z n=1 Tax=Pseudofulvibacter geojedonensis TaxID=1123758 RepID=A0ABW3HY38_9FLAO
MIFSKTGNTTIITQERATIIELVSKIEEKHKDFSNDNIIVNLFSVKEMLPNAINDFLSISKKHKNESNKSFVIVSSKIKIDDVPEELTIVPTLQEAHDIIEMEEIERDLAI